jgi:hypothetical protein
VAEASVVGGAEIEASRARLYLGGSFGTEFAVSGSLG